jgi:hypothetical protein
MPLKVWFFSHVLLTLALGARNTVPAHRGQSSVPVIETVVHGIGVS